METKSKRKNVDEQVASAHREQRLVLLSSEGSQEALKWAKEVAEEKEKFWRREAKYYNNFARKQSDLANAKSYARVRRALSALLEPNAGQHPTAEAP
jgi:molecular chaperone GrpE (heat shock protein)